MKTPEKQKMQKKQQLNDTNSRSLRSLICNFKPIYPLLDSIGVIYSIPCKNCDVIYIGQTGRKLHDRMSEHRRAYKIQDLNSKPFQHLMDLNQAPEFFRL